MPVEVASEEAVKENGETPSTKSNVGIIYPPPEVRNIVDKTAGFVARNGPEFEARIRQNEINNPKFNFLNEGDPYHGYYKHKVEDEKKRNKDGKSLEPAPPPPSAKSVAEEKQKVEQQKILDQIIRVKDPPPEFEFIADPPSISAFDLDVVRLTAQFVARNGRQFLTQLMNREQRNFQFDFLRPQHSLFNYFTRLVEQYTKVLMPPRDIVTKLNKDAVSQNDVWEKVRYRVEWLKVQDAKRRKEDEEHERERVAYAQVDWHDFVIVETVDFQPHETGQFPPPTTPDEVGSRALIQDRIDDGQEIEMDVESDEEEEVEGDEEQPQQQKEKVPAKKEETRPLLPPPPPPATLGEKPALSLPPPPPLPPMPDQVIIRKDYDPKMPKTNLSSLQDEFLISPITGERIAASKVQEHMRIGLLDPRWVEQRDRTLQDRLAQEEVYAGGGSIESNLRLLAERRTDIFGQGDEETMIGRKIGEKDPSLFGEEGEGDEEKRSAEVWDGHKGSADLAAQRAKASIEDQIYQIHKVQGTVPESDKDKMAKSVIVVQPAPHPRPPPQVIKPPVPVPPPSVVARQHIAVSAAPPLQRPPMPSISTMAGMPPMLGMMGPRPGMPGMPHHMMVNPMSAMGFGGGMPMPPMPVGMGVPPGPMNPMMQAQKQQAGGPLDDEPAGKKQKTEESLMPELQFLQMNKSPVTFKVSIPNMSDKPEWKMSGQALTLTLPLTDMISVVKAKIHEEVGLPPGKQKLLYDSLFVKDSNSLAFYNVMPNTTIHLMLKERGGRKK